MKGEAGGKGQLHTDYRARESRETRLVIVWCLKPGWRSVSYSGCCNAMQSCISSAHEHDHHKFCATCCALSAQSCLHPKTARANPFVQGGIHVAICPGWKGKSDHCKILEEGNVNVGLGLVGLLINQNFAELKPLP